MQVEPRHQPSFATARIHLAAGESFQAESGAMAAHSTGIDVQAQMQGGLVRALSRSVLGGESLFVTTFTAHPQQAGWVDLAARLPGDVLVFDVTPGSGLVLTRGSWLGSAATVTLDTKWGGASSMFGGEGGFVIQATGHGSVIASCYGAVDQHDLPAGGGFTVDTGHVVAYEESIPRPALRRVSKGILTTLKSGEGLVFDFVGPGTVWTQNRNPNEFLSWISRASPSRQ